MMAFEVVSPTPDMANDMGRIHALSWQSAYQGIIPESALSRITPESRKDLFLKLSTGGVVEYLLFQVNGEPAGMAALHKCRDEDAGETDGEISALYFLPQFWGKGCAKHAMSACLDWFTAHGYTRSLLWVLEDNLRAQRFYEKSGFSLDGGRKEIVIGKPLYEVRYAIDIAHRA